MDTITVKRTSQFKPSKKLYHLYKNDNHVYYALLYEGCELPIVFDCKDNDLTDINWTIMKNGYVCYRGEYMHRKVFYKYNERKDDQKSIDHINMFKLDNRLINLREATQSEQNSNRAARCDKLEPCQELKDIGIHELPKHVRWDKTEKKFVIEKHPSLINEVKAGIRKKPCMSGTKSSTISVTQKYQDILARLEELDNQRNPDIVAFNSFKAKLAKEYIDIVTTIYTYEGKDIPDSITSNDEPEISRIRKTLPGRKKECRLPESCGIDPSAIPKYCWYKPASEKRGDSFIIDRHPLLEKSWSTTSSTTYSTKEKFDMLLCKYKELC
jgi:hypothetical protein